VEMVVTLIVGSPGSGDPPAKASGVVPLGPDF